MRSDVLVHYTGMSIENKIDKIFDKIFEMDQKIESIQKEMATKADLADLEGRIFTTLDQQGQILQRLDQERLFTLERVKRIEADVEHMKQVLKIA